MPNKDGTGPNGQGKGTGRGMGRCGNSADINPAASEKESPELPSAVYDSQKAFGKRDGSGCGTGIGAGKNGAGRRCCGR